MIDRRARRAAPRYDTSIDRAGIALGAGSGLAGIIIVVLVLMGGRHDPMSIVSGWMIGSVFAAFAITAVGGPLWLVLHAAGLRRARHAALAGAITAMAIFVGAQTYGFGLLDVPPMDGRALLYRWLSAILSSAVLALAAGAIGVVMWRIAYRRID